jgi:eukaryotic-like serine/threonine-protein kinase
MTTPLPSGDRWRRLEPILDAALDLPPSERARYLDAACAHDHALRAEVEALLLAAEEEESLLARPVGEAFPALMDEQVPAPERLGAYRVTGTLGTGGMATVFLADDARHGRQVAVKVLHPALARVVGAERFRREIEVAARLSHPHVLAVHDSGEVAGDAAGRGTALVYYVTPYLTGESLRDRLRREGALPVADALRLAGEVADALEYSHRQGVVHCDVKPENILLHEGHAVVADFGIARAVTAGGAAAAPLLAGTPGYMSPEQRDGGSPVDARSDVYALGLVLAEMLTGQRDSPPAASDAGALPAALRSIITRATAHAPAARYPTARAMAEALAEALRQAQRAGEGTVEGDANAVSQASRWRRRLVVGGALLAVAAVGSFALLSARRPAAEPAAGEGERIAVAPFDVPEPALALWREGMVDLLSRQLDGAGPLRAVPPTRVVRAWQGRADAASARALAARTSAKLVVYGALLSAGDSVRATLSVLDAVTGRQVAELERRDLGARMDRLGDSLAIGILRALARTRRVDQAGATSAPTTSLAALKAFLQGEQAYRRAEWDSADAHFSRALAIDTTFAMAWHRLAGVREWRDWSEFGDSTVFALHARAGRITRGLAPRERLLIRVDSIRAEAYAALRERMRGNAVRHEALVRLLAATLRDASHRYPDDPEIAHLRAVTLLENDPYLERGEMNEAAIMAAFDRAIALDSSFAPAYLDPIMLVLYRSGGDSARRYIDAYLATRPSGAGSEVLTTVHRLLGAEPGRGVDAVQLATTLPVERACDIAMFLRRHADSAETAVRMLRALAARTGEPAACSTVAAALALQYRGHLREAAALATRPQHWLRPMSVFSLARFGMIGPDSARAEFRRFGALAPRVFSTDALRWWAADRDTASIARYLVLLRQRIAEEPATFGTILTGNVLAGEGYLTLARGDTARAIRQLQSIPDSLQRCFHYARLTLAQLLVSARRDEEAGRLLARPWPGTVTCGNPVDDVLWAMERARLHERQGKRGEAAEGYRLVASAWRGADPELQPLVREAHVALERLGDVRSATSFPSPQSGIGVADPSRRRTPVP